MLVNSIIKKDRVGLAIVVAGLLTACSGQQVPKNVKEYFQDKPIVEYENFVEDIENFNLAQTQAKLDSLAYREIFNATNAINDSNIVKEYNDIASNGRNVIFERNLFENLAKTGISLKEYTKIQEDNYYRRSNGITGSIGAYYIDKIQHKIDSIEYRKLFEKYNLLDSINLNKFKEISDKIKP